MCQGVIKRKKDKGRRQKKVTWACPAAASKFARSSATTFALRLVAPSPARSHSLCSAAAFIRCSSLNITSAFPATYLLFHNKPSTRNLSNFSAPFLTAIRNVSFVSVLPFKSSCVASNSFVVCLVFCLTALSLRPCSLFCCSLQVSPHHCQISFMSCRQ